MKMVIRHHTWFTPVTVWQNCENGVVTPSLQTGLWRELIARATNRRCSVGRLLFSFLSHIDFYVKMSLCLRWKIYFTASIRRGRALYNGICEFRKRIKRTAINMEWPLFYNSCKGRQTKIDHWFINKVSVAFIENYILHYNRTLCCYICMPSKNLSAHVYPSMNAIHQIDQLTVSLFIKFIKSYRHHVMPENKSIYTYIFKLLNSSRSCGWNINHNTNLWHFPKHRIQTLYKILKIK